MMRVVGPRQPGTDEVDDQADHSDAYGMQLQRWKNQLCVDRTGEDEATPESFEYVLRAHFSNVRNDTMRLVFSPPEASVGIGGCVRVI